MIGVANQSPQRYRNKLLEQVLAAAGELDSLAGRSNRASKNLPACPVHLDFATTPKKKMDFAEMDFFWEDFAEMELGSTGDLLQKFIADFRFRVQS